MTPRVLIVAAAIALVGGCTLPSSDEFVKASTTTPTEGGAPPASLDAGVAETGSVVDARSTADSGEPVVNLLSSDVSGFENGDCSGIGYYQASGTASTPAHTGIWACNVCRGDPSNTFYSVNPYVVQKNPVVGKRYRATAWVRALTADDVGEPIVLGVRTHKISPFRLGEETDGPIVDLTQDWAQIESHLDVTKPAEALDMFIAGQPAAGGTAGCFLVDDMVVWLEGDSP